MKWLREELEVDGRKLRRYVFAPDSPDQIRAASFHFHGQGDYSERYDETMEVFTRHGVACVATDLPGHGKSEGKRGHVPGFRVVDQVARANERRCRELCPAGRGPLGITGHSAGGLMGLRELLRRPAPYSFSWISAPLMRPEANQNPLLVRLAPLVSRLIPRLTVATGVTSEQCVHGGDELERLAGDEDVLFHSRVSVGWGLEMMRAAAEVREKMVSAPPAIPILFTQGGADPVCPARFLREVLGQASIPKLRYREFPEGLHEAFADTVKHEVFAELSDWLGETLRSMRSQTSPSG